MHNWVYCRADQPINGSKLDLGLLCVSLEAICLVLTHQLMLCSTIKSMYGLKLDFGLFCVPFGARFTFFNNKKCIHKPISASKWDQKDSGTREMEEISRNWSPNYNSSVSIIFWICLTLQSPQNPPQVSNSANSPYFHLFHVLCKFDPVKPSQNAA